MSKKASKDKTQTEYSVSDTVLGKLRGYPPWPGIVLDADHVPKSIASERPKGRVFCVKFFPRGDHAWLTAKDLQRLDKDDIDAFLAATKKPGELADGYKAARDPVAWEAETARKAEEAADGDDQLEDEEGADGDGSKKSRKRKRDSEPAGRGRKKGESASKKKKRTKKNGVGDGGESEDDGGATDGKDHSSKRKKVDKEDDDEKYAHLKSDPEAVRIKTVRHQLQKAFLGKNGPVEADMEESDKLFKDLETQELSIDHLSFSKIGKVMRHIASLDESALPGGADSRYHFRSRAADLVARWHRVLNRANVPTVAAANGAAAEDV